MRLVAKPRAEAGLIDDALRRREAGQGAVLAEKFNMDAIGRSSGLPR